jgi:adenylate cyclase
MAAQRLRAETRAGAVLTAERANLAGYVSPALAEMVARGDVAALDGRTQETAVLFVDVAGYTALSEALAPAGVAAFLRDLHLLFERCASANGGVITDFAGDGAMIVFGLPEPSPADAARAVACGAMLLREADGFRSEAIGGRRVTLRVSVHAGPVTTAILGGARQAQVTVTGDTVNVASRLQETAKEHGASFVISRAALDAALAEDPGAGAGFTALPDQSIRGRAGKIAVLAYRPEGTES